MPGCTHVHVFVRKIALACNNDRSCLGKNRPGIAEILYVSLVPMLAIEIQTGVPLLGNVRRGIQKGFGRGDAYTIDAEFLTDTLYFEGIDHKAAFSYLSRMPSGKNTR